MKELNTLITNTTSLVGYIAILMFVGAYLGGNQNHMFDPSLLKGNIGEYSRSGFGINPIHSSRSAVITIDGRQYEVVIGNEIVGKPEFSY